MKYSRNKKERADLVKQAGGDIDNLQIAVAK